MFLRSQFLRSHAIRYFVFVAALLVGGSFPAFAQSPTPPGWYPTVTVNKAGSGTGTVTVRPSVDFGARYVELTAIPDAGSVFAGWSPGCTSAGNWCLLMVRAGQSVTVTATFNAQIVLTASKLSVAKAGNGTGTVTSDVGPINCGTTCSAPYTNGTVVTLTAAAGAGQTFTGWSGGACSGTGTCVVTVKTATTVTAMFTDAIPPNTTINSGPSDPSSDDSPTFTFSSTEPHSTFRCQLDGATSASCASPYTVSVGNGPHTFAVFAVDAGGNADPTPATYFWTAAHTTSTPPLPPSASGPIPTVDLNQHGLTGSWYEPATSGQGFAVEVFPNQLPGNGHAFVSWFTYDTVIGGAERQRWYSAQGQVMTGQPNASLTIYQNTGGSFNTLPATSPQAVGTATLSFDTCSSGQLSYKFTDGTGRSGTIPLKRLMPNVTCSTTTSHPTNADFALSGSWFDSATSGQGFSVEINPNSNTAFTAWYTYMPNDANAGAAGQRWYSAQGTFTPGMRSIPVTIYETTGGIFDTPAPLGQHIVQVGTGTMTFQSCSAATFDYDFTGGTSAGLSGTITLGRVGPVPSGCAS